MFFSLIQKLRRKHHNSMSVWQASCDGTNLKWSDALFSLLTTAKVRIEGVPG